ncbi:MAG TPA: hypothetical protein VML00_00500 [Bacteroidota bacterium]|nr:hypothetical protein [Bacteroidota bacterium]
MSTGVFSWFAVGGISAIVFFGIAVVATWRGLAELRELLGRKEPPRAPE